MDLPSLVTAIGGLGVASAGLVDAAKAIPFLGVNHLGFPRIRATIKLLTPPDPAEAPVTALSPQKVLETLKANWYNGTDLNNQKAIAKSLIKLRFHPGTARQLALVADVDPDGLVAVAQALAAGAALTPSQSDLFGRFDLSLTAIIDAAYQASDQTYRNGSKVCAMGVSVLLAVLAK